MIATRFSASIHILALLAQTERATSGALAEAVGTHPVVVRRLSKRLEDAGLIRIRRGPGGAELAMNADQISLADIWRAVRERGEPMIPLHGTPDPSMRWPLHDAFDAAEAALETHLAKTSVADILATRAEA